MRPRIKHGKDRDVVIKYKDMNKYLTDNNCYGITASFKKDKTIEYLYVMMYRQNKKPPVEAKIVVSIVSKNVLYGLIDGVRMSSVKEFMDKCKFNTH